MKLLLKDCVRYVPHEYKNEAELEAMVFEHYREILGENSLIFPKKKIKVQLTSVRFQTRSLSISRVENGS